MTGIVFSFLVLKVMPMRVLTGTDEILQYRHRINRQVGLHANSLALYLCGLIWGMYAATRGRWLGKLRLPVLFSAVAVTVTFILTYSRSGYVAFVMIGLIFGALYWRFLWILFPVGMVAVLALFPSVGARILMGIRTDAIADEVVFTTAGRVEYMWPPVVEQIGQAPLFGIGRVGILRSPAYDKIVEVAGGCPSHPHSTFLEILLDTGMVGLAIVIVMMIAIIFMSVRLARCRDDELLSAIGATSLAMAAAAIIAGAGGRFFMIPSHYLMMIWCVWALALRGWVAQQKHCDVTLSSARGVPVRRTPMSARIAPPDSAGAC